VRSSWTHVGDPTTTTHLVVRSKLTPAFPYLFFSIFSTHDFFPSILCLFSPHQELMPFSLPAIPKEDLTPKIGRTCLSLYDFDSVQVLSLLSLPFCGWLIQAHQKTVRYIHETSRDSFLIFFSRRGPIQVLSGIFLALKFLVGVESFYHVFGCRAPVKYWFFSAAPPSERYFGFLYPLTTSPFLIFS